MTNDVVLRNSTEAALFFCALPNVSSAQCIAILDIAHKRLTFSFCRPPIVSPHSSAQLPLSETVPPQPSVQLGPS
jgi:hypothetical protein